MLDALLGVFLVLCFPKAHASQSEVESPWTGKMFHQIFQSSTECIPLITDKESAIRKKVSAASV